MEHVQNMAESIMLGLHCKHENLYLDNDDQHHYLLSISFNLINSFMIIHGVLGQWGRSNRPRIRPGTLKKSERAIGVVIVSPSTGLGQEN